MSASAAKWLLASVIVARSSSFLFSKFILVSMNPFELLGLRFFLAFAFLLLVYRKRVMRTFSWDMVRKGAILGITLALGMAAEMCSTNWKLPFPLFNPTANQDNRKHSEHNHSGNP